MIDGTERFIATAIRFVRIEPEAPTIVPATISAKLSSAMPAAAAERPVKAFSSEITTGMSAPPIGSTTMLPSSAAATRMPRMNSASECTPEAIAIAEPTQTSSSTRFSSCWPGSLIGRPGRISCSFANAMFEPQKEIEPMIAANSDGIIAFAYQSPSGPGKPWRNSAQAISATAPPPTPLKSATICGIAVIFTLSAEGMPTAVPITMPTAIRTAVSPSGRTPGISSVATTAISIPTAAILLPRTAVFGPARPRRPTMKRITARM